MSEPAFSIHEARIAIVGLGLMGGSLALDLQGQCAALLAVDPDPDTRDLARTRQIVDEISGDPADILPAADLIIFAAPVRVIIQLLRSLPALHPGTAVVLDLGSTKAAIVEEMAQLPTRFDPIGAHPMCGREVSSLVHAYSGMYRGAPFAITSLERTQQKARAAVTQLVGAIGANPLWLDAAEHDRWVAATSHLPYLVANALAAATPPEAAPLVGPGFLSTTRLASSSPQMMLDILATNREAVLSALSDLDSQLLALKSLLQAEDWQGLRQLLEAGAEGRRNLI